MKLFLIVVSTFAFASAESPTGQGGYSLGSFSPVGGSFNFGNGGYSTGFNGGANSFSAGGYSSGPSDGQGGAGAPAGDSAKQGPQVFKYVSVHAAPEDPEDHATKSVRVPGGSNKHVNIIFVKAPSNGADQKTEVVLPEQDEHKSLVYVLVKKTDSAANLQIRQPQPTTPPKPEVYFIRYKNQPSQGAEANNGQGQPIPVDFSKNITPAGGSNGSPSPAYGVP